MGGYVGLETLRLILKLIWILNFSFLNMTANHVIKILGNVIGANGVVGLWDLLLSNGRLCLTNRKADKQLSHYMHLIVASQLLDLDFYV